jgi:hypothetical protein
VLPLRDTDQENDRRRQKQLFLPHVPACATPGETSKKDETETACQNVEQIGHDPPGHSGRDSEIQHFNFA